MSTTTPIAAAAAQTIVNIPLSQLRESPFNYRRRFTGLDELAASIRAEGRIHQALKVRPRRVHMLKDKSDPGMDEGYEIVFGHRRFRAAPLADLAEVPCVIEEMTDAQVRSAQAAENIQREDPHPIEEAEGFQYMMEHDGKSADELAAMVGKSRSYVYSRLKLLAAIPAVRDLCLAGEMGSETALLFARLRTPKLQERALGYIRCKYISLTDGGKESFRRIQSELMERFTLRLKEAIFPLEDATLVPDAGVCSACPKRAGNAPEYEDVAAYKGNSSYDKKGGPDCCTDPDCWEAKKTAHLRREADKLRAGGVEVVDSNKARVAIGADGKVKGAYIPLAEAQKIVKAAAAKSTKPFPPVVPTPVVIQNPRDGKTAKAVRVADLVAAGVMKAAAAKAKPADQYEERRRREAEQEARNRAKAAELTRQNMALLQHVRLLVAQRQRDAFDLRLVTAAALAGVGHVGKRTLATLWDVRDATALERRIESDSLSAAELQTLLMDCALVDGIELQYWQLNAKPGPLLALAEHYGVDVNAVMQASAPPPVVTETDPTATPSTAGARAKKVTAAAAPGPACTPAPAAPAAKKVPPGVRYRNPATGDTWTGRGLQPAWLKAALASGAKLADFEVKNKAGSAGNVVKDEPAGAGIDRDPLTRDWVDEAYA